MKTSTLAWYSLALLLAVALMVAALTATKPAPSAADRADAIAAELRCPVCQGLSVADSPSTTAREIRRQIEVLLAQGASAEQVRQHFAARYGDWILLSPRPALAWVVPPLAVAAGGCLLVVWLRRSRRTEANVADAAGQTALRERVRREVRELDA
ncbi:MAG: cytochrome c-type biogenesis protein [Candidatus Limnocylindria bacterium]